jgi:hypothetical protein
VVSSSLRASGREHHVTTCGCGVRVSSNAWSGSMPLSLAAEWHNIDLLLRGRSIRSTVVRCRKEP